MGAWNTMIAGCAQICMLKTAFRPLAASAKYGGIDNAFELFGRMFQRDVISCNATIVG